MTTFISWSGPRSRVLAQNVSGLVRATLPGARPWMSTDIRRGTPWATELFSRLDRADACILCLTADSVTSPWLLFEAGAVLAASSGSASLMCLCFDVSTASLRDHLFGSLPQFACERTSLAQLVGLLAATNEGPTLEMQSYDASWPTFLANLQAIPPLVPRAFQLIALGPSLTPTAIEIDVDEDKPWTAMVEALCGMPPFPLPSSRWDELRYLDIDGESWSAAPGRLSDVAVRRLAVVHPDTPGHWRDSAKLASTLLRETLDVIPTRTAARATLERDLRALAVAQQGFHEAHGAFAPSLEDVAFTPAPENEIEFVAGECGWAARATRSDYPMHLAVRVGDGAGNFADHEENEVFAVDFEQTQLFALDRPGPGSGR